MGYSSERATIGNSALIHDKMCMYMSLLFDRSESPYRPSEIQSSKQSASLCSHVTHKMVTGLEKYAIFWDITIQDLETAFNYAITRHWSIEEILHDHYLYYTPFVSIAQNIDLLPKTVAFYCTVGTNLFLESYSQLSHTRYLSMPSDQHSIALLEALDPYIPNLTL